MRRELILSLAGCLACFCIYAQTSTAADQLAKFIPKPMPQSPNVASLGRFGNYELDFYTGLPNISISLYEVKSGSLSVPITLSYHASGIRMTDVASWVGQGWSLSAGGAISRTMKNRPDEMDYYTNTLIPDPEICGNFVYIKKIVDQVIDAEPDVFSYSYPGKSGKFMLKQNGSLSLDGTKPYLLIPYEPIAVTPDYTLGAFNKFEITNEGGVLYRFGKNSIGAIAQEVSSNENNTRDPSAVTAWHLMEMISPNADDKITFNYNSLGYAAIVDYSDYITIADEDVGDGIINTGVMACSHNSTATQMGLSEIYFEGGKVEFLANTARLDQPNLKQLDYIKIYSEVNGVYTPIKQFKFIYTYYSKPGGTNVSLKLDELQVWDVKTAALNNRYVFTYNTNTFSWDSYDKRDAWGFYNNGANTDMVPHQQVDVVNPTGSGVSIWIGGATDLAAKPQYLQEGVLKRIQYPTGGYTDFEYEPHQYLDGSTPTYAGGLRISKIKSYDGINPLPIEKTYKYGTGESGNGYKNFMNNAYIATILTRFVCFFVDCSTTPTRYYRTRSFFSGSAIEMDGFEGSPVVYPIVTEYYGNNTTNIGKIVYEYDNGTFIGDEIDPIYSAVASKLHRRSHQWERGHLSKKSTYDVSGNLLSTSATSYQRFQYQNTQVGTMAGRAIEYPAIYYQTSFLSPCQNEFGDWVDGQELAFGHCYQSSGAFRESATTDVIYESGNLAKSVSKTRWNTFDPSFLQVTEQKEESNASTDLTITRNLYPFSYTYSGSETGAAKGASILNNLKIRNLSLESYTLKQNADGTSGRVIGGQITTFKTNPANASKAVMDEIYMLETGVSFPIATYNASNITSNVFTMDPHYKSRASFFYDQNDNVRQVQKSKDIPTAYQWGYKNSLPVAEVKNASSTQYQTITPSTGFYNNISFGGPTINGTVTYTSGPFTVEYTGTVKLKLGISGNPAYLTYAAYNLSGQTGSMTLTNAQSCGYDVAVIANVPPGTYTMSITLSASVSTPSLGACGSIEYPVNATINNGAVEFLFEGFEENMSVNVTADPTKSHTGNRYFLGDALIYFTIPNTRKYVIEYWYLDANNVWQYTSKQYSGTNMTLTEGTAIDDVRIYPTDATMTSYTYTPALGVTSVTDINGYTTYYEYDALGRLQVVKDNNRNILKSYIYNYK